MPTQPLARSNAAAACGLLMLIVPSGSIMLPPPLERLPLQCVAGQTFVGVALPDEAPEVGVRSTLAFLDRLCHLVQLGPRWRER